jgi:hypothetical protein
MLLPAAGRRMRSIVGRRNGLSNRFYNSPTMPTDFAPVRAHISEAAGRLRSNRDARARDVASLRRALEPDFDASALAAACLAAAAGAKKSWNGALFTHGEDINRQFACGREPDDYALVASDGSQIMPDRHKPVLYAMLQVACACIIYGQASGRIDSATTRDARLLFEDELYDADTGELIAPGELATERDLREIEALAARCETLAAAGLRTIALADGALIPFVLLNDSRLRPGDRRLARFAEALGRLRDAGAVVAGYIARPNSNAVARACALAVGARDEPAPPGLLDRHLLEGVLKPGWRGARFQPCWTVNGDEFLGRRGHTMLAFYLDVGAGRPEIARVELPAWCASAEQLDALTGVLARHARIGGGYPFCLKAAHEEAIITRQDQREIDARIQFEMAEQGMLAMPSPKQEAKDQR